MIDVADSAAPVPTTAAAVPWWRGAAVYQVYPRSFADANGDGIGDLAGIIGKLDYIASLGVDAVWIAPFFTSPMADFGYDVADYRGVDPIFGTLADFDRLVSALHDRGLKLIIDLVFAHTSDQHPWFADSRSSRDARHSNFYVWADAKPEGSPPSNWQSVFGGPAWTWDARRGQYYLHNFLAAQPQLNLHNPAVQAELVDVARFWLDRGVDGFRLDAINFAMHDPLLRDNPPVPAGVGQRTRPFDFQQHIFNQSQPGIVDFLERLRALFDEYGAIHTVAEVGGNDADAEMKAFTAGNARLNSAYGFDYLYAPALTPALVARCAAAWDDAPGTGWPSWAFSNHDAPRWLSRWAPDGHRDAFARMALTLFACLRGNIILWQGEELGLTQIDVPFEQLQDPEAIANWPLTLSRDGARSPMPWVGNAAHCGFTTGQPWLPLGDDRPALAVDRQDGDPTSLLSLTRALLALRRQTAALRLGAMDVLVASDDLLVFRRSHAGRSVLVACNFSAKPQRWQAANAAAWHSIFGVNGADGWDLPAFGAAIWENRV